LKKLASWNVNGIRACYRKGFLDWIDKELPDYTCLQEIKAEREQFPIEILDRKKTFIDIFSAKKKGYSGVALLSKTEPVNLWHGISMSEFDDEGRTIVAEFKDFVLYNCYFPNGQRDLARVPYKLAFSEEVMKHALKMKKKTGKEIIICGDYNTSHTEIDLANPKPNRKSTGFLPEERAWIDKFIGNGFNDVFRQKHPDENGHYTWWTYRGDCRERNIGWRLDYFFTSDGLVKKVKDVYHQTHVMGSDHCPVILELAIK
jgi:exodeoxyribonuclease III